MTLDRKKNPDGKGKYSLILNRKVAALAGKDARRVAGALKTLAAYGVLDDGLDPDDEFFVMRLRDLHAAAGLAAYGTEASHHGDKEFGHAVLELASKSFKHPKRRRQD